MKHNHGVFSSKSCSSQGFLVLLCRTMARRPMRPHPRTLECTQFEEVYMCMHTHTYTDIQKYLTNISWNTLYNPTKLCQSLNLYGATNPSWSLISGHRRRISLGARRLSRPSAPPRPRSSPDFHRFGGHYSINRNDNKGNSNSNITTTIVNTNN